MNYRRPRFSWFGVFRLIFLLVPLLAACSPSPPTLAGPSVSMSDNEFTPATLHIKPGQTVTWVNNGQTVHTVTADDGSFNSQNIQPGAEYSRTFTTAG
ncbi:MAG TPA: cupredoxin domain-containing protein, partial [Ktedonobacteraceae bacterium]